MAIKNGQIADFFYRMAELLEIQGADQFRAGAYRRAAILIDSFPEDVARLVANGRDLTELPAIGKDLAGKIREICDSGQLKALDTLEASTSPALVALSKVRGLGPRRITILRERLGVDSIDSLAKAASEGRIRNLRGFGPRFEARLIDDLKQLTPVR